MSESDKIFQENSIKAMFYHGSTILDLIKFHWVMKHYIKQELFKNEQDDMIAKVNSSMLSSYSLLNTST